MSFVSGCQSRWYWQKVASVGSLLRMDLKSPEATPRPKHNAKQPSATAPRSRVYVYIYIYIHIYIYIYVYINTFPGPGPGPIPPSMSLRTLSPDGVTHPRSQLFHVKMWKKVENAESMWENVWKCGEIVEKCAENVGNVENV